MTSRLSRRSFITGLASAPMLGMLGCGHRDARPLRSPATKPWAGERSRYFMLVTLPGGLDAVLTTDPKRRNDVSSRVDIPYGDSDIVDVAGRSYGPHFKPLERWLSKLTVINNVRTFTVSHEGGRVQVRHLRSIANEQQPLVSELVAPAADEPPLPSVSLGTAGFSPSTLDCTGPRYGVAPDLCDALDGLRPDEVEDVAYALDQLSGAGRRGTPMGVRSEYVARYVRHAAKAPRFATEKWADEVPPEQRMVFGGPLVEPAEKYLQRALWLFENDLATSVNYLVQGFEWDSHFRNLEWQTKNSMVFFPLLARFFDELHRRRNKYGSLADNTTIVIMSELGRFPYLNSDEGKDHLPEAPVMVFGPRFRAGEQFGSSGRDLEGQPVDVATGRRHDNGHFVTIDDIGATVLSAFDLDPLHLGYTGRVLDFLKRTA